MGNSRGAETPRILNGAGPRRGRTDAAAFRRRGVTHKVQVSGPLGNSLSSSRGPKVSSMGTRRSTELGLVSLASALFVGILSVILPYVWDALITRATTDTFLGQSVRLFWIPAGSDALLVGMAVLGLIGLVLVWAGRWELGSEYAARVGLALLSMLVAGVALALWLATGVLLGSFSGFSGLVPWRGLLAFVGTVFLGFAFYWIVANLPLTGR